MMACVRPPVEEGQIGFEGKTPPNLHPKNGTNGVTLNSSGQVNGSIMRRTTPSPSSTPPPNHTAMEPKLSTMSEEDLVEQWDNELSVEAQAQKLCMFLSSSTSDSGEEAVTETVITSVYRDPLEFCMEGLEEMARKILRTGKLVTNGEPGDMGKIQPALFNLQASEKEMPQLYPQLLQVAFFSQGSQQEQILNLPDFEGDEAFLDFGNMDKALANGNIRVAIPVDTAIYALLRSHCAKGARQAEEMINTAMIGTYIPTTNLSKPPIVKFHSTPRPSHSWNTGNSSPTLAITRPENRKQKSWSSLSQEDWSPNGSSYKVSTHSSLSAYTTNTNNTSCSSLPRSEASNSSLRKCSDEPPALLQRPGSSERRIGSIDENMEPAPTPRLHIPLVKSMSNPVKTRRISKILKPPTLTQGRSRGDSTGSDVSLSESSYVPSSNLWNTSIIDNNTMVAQYGSQAYPIVWWDPEYKIDFRLSTSVGILSGNVIGIDPSKPEVTLKVFNNSAKQVGFAIRSHRQSTQFSSHVVYPNKGLELLEPYKSWEDNVQFLPNSTTTTEMFVIDLFFCTMDTKPVWNVMRKYAIMKADKTSSALRRVSKRRMSHMQLPGARDQKAEHIELVLSHGLQCVVKGKLNEAEIILSQALFLPDFQRVPIKAFLYICLGVIANKRIKQGQGASLIPVLTCVESSSKLVNVCEQGPGSIKMPYTIQLVKQLKKELNVEKLMKEKHRKIESNRKSSGKVDDKGTVKEFKNITPEGAELTFSGTTITIPPHTLTQDTDITVTLANSKHLIPMLKASGWEKIVQLATAIHVECNPPVDNFAKAIDIITTLPEDSHTDGTSMIRLMHSNYLRHWEDITDDVLSKIKVEGERVHIKTNLTGWLAISKIKFDASTIAQMVLKSISIEPVMMRFSVFGFIDTERKSIQVAVFAVPCTASEEPIHKDIERPENFLPISFPHVVEAYPSERLRLEIQGSFEPDESLGDESLVFEMDMQQKHNQILSKWIKSTSPPDTPLNGKLKISSCRNSSDKWESIAHIGLSMRSGCTSSGTSSASDHNC